LVFCRRALDGPHALYDILRRPRDPVAAKKAMADAGYNGEKVVVISLSDVPEMRTLTLVGIDQLRRAGSMSICRRWISAR